MYKYLLLIILFINYFLYSDAQNLVPNSSFEDTISCPNGAGQIDLARGWISFNGTPDYFNSCVACSIPLGCFGIPGNVWGSQQAFDGKAYTGIATYYEQYQYREIVGAQLLQPLSPGKKYFVSFYVSRAGGYSFLPYHSDGGSNNLGFRFFMNSYSASDPNPIDNFAHINETSIIIDTINWIRISGTLIADSAYQYIAIGNFFDDQHTDTIHIKDLNSSIQNAAYYYIDNVCVSEDSLDCQLIDKVDNKKLKLNVTVFPNPFNDKLTIENESNEGFEISIYDFSYQNIFNQKFSHRMTLNTSDFGKGFYFYRITNKNGVLKSGKVIKL